MSRSRKSPMQGRKDIASEEERQSPGKSGRVWIGHRDVAEGHETVVGAEQLIAVADTEVDGGRRPVGPPATSPKDSASAESKRSPMREAPRRPQTCLGGTARSLLACEKVAIAYKISRRRPMTASPIKTPVIKLRRRSTLRTLVSTKNRQRLRCLPTHPCA